MTTAFILVFIAFPEIKAVDFQFIKDNLTSIIVRNAKGNDIVQDILYKYCSDEATITLGITPTLSINALELCFKKHLTKTLDMNIHVIDTVQPDDIVFESQLKRDLLYQVYDLDM